MSKWIDINEKLPPLNIEILVCYTFEYEEGEGQLVDIVTAFDYGCFDKDHIKEENEAREVVWNGLKSIEFSSKVRACTNCPGELQYENLDGCTVRNITHWMKIPKLP